ncbi:MAG: hypothetical protein ACHQ6T_19235 [Myxococcota bacterium]
MSHAELHQMDRARALHPDVPAAKLAATLAEASLVLLVVGVWLVTCLAG